MFNMHMCPIPLFSVIWCQANEKKWKVKKIYKHELVKIILLLLFPRKKVYFFFLLF